MYKEVCALFVVSILSAALMQSGCSHRQAQNRPVKERITISFSMDTLKELWYKDKISFVKEVEKQNANIIVDIDYDDPAKQLDQVKQMPL